MNNKEKNMYNEERKRQYIASKKGSRTFETNMENWFDKTEPYESAHNKDVSDLEIAEIINLYTEVINTPSILYLELIHSTLRDYVRWANPGNKSYELMSREMVAMCVDKDRERQRIILRDQLLHDLDYYLRNSFEKAILLALFEGIKLKDFEYLTKDQIDEENGVVYLSGRTLRVSPNLIRYMIDAANTYEINAYNDSPQYTISKFVELWEDDKRVIKQMAAFTESDRMTRYRNIIKRCHDIIQCDWVSASELPQSGIVNLLYEEWKRQPNKSITDIAKEKTKEIQERYNRTWVYNVPFKKKYGYLFAKRN